ncbi:hypothetical protein [Halomonas lysinitropha]|uniref:hypothetical protein n=1 Tax=Halomonas lysinitropha TaxID=2607506 RepID=UPI001788B929|nr:hypothetical protein [Halomonas lysinitropha]
MTWNLECRNNNSLDDNSQGEPVAAPEISQTRLFERLTGDEDGLQRILVAAQAAPTR